MTLLWVSDDSDHDNSDTDTGNSTVESFPSTPAHQFAGKWAEHLAEALRLITEIRAEQAKTALGINVTPSILSTWNHFQQQHGGKGWSRDEMVSKYHKQRSLDGDPH